VVIQRIDVGFEQDAGIELMVAQPLIEFLPLLFDCFARGVVSADQQVADNPFERRARAVTDTTAGSGCPSFRMYVSYVECPRCRREALNTEASKPGAIGVWSSTLSARARSITSCGSEMSAGGDLFTTSAAV